ncbi:MAG: MucR family transcriptional regulator, partial [Geminicoccaceae bacterium]
LTTEIVAAYAGSHTLPASELPGLIGSVFGALRKLGTVAEPAPPPAEALVPAVPIRKSVMPGYLVCLEDGRKTKLLKPHLAKHHGLTPAAYRQRWGLAKDYPMTAPAYAAERSAMATSSGLGRKSVAAASTPEPAAAPVPEPAPVAPQPAGRVHVRKRTKNVSTLGVQLAE